MSYETRDLLDKLFAVVPGARGLAALWLALGLFTLICASAMGKAVGVLPIWLVAAPLAVLAVLGPGTAGSRSSQA